jgi:hypothetical protein
MIRAASPNGQSMAPARSTPGYVMRYCPHDQTAGRVLKDRRLSRLLK